MPLCRWKSRSDVGNSLIEFVFIFCFGLIAVLAISSEVERNIRGHFAALSVANEFLRAFQLEANELDALRAANFAAATFGLAAGDIKIEITAECVTGGRIEVAAQVREAKETASADC